VPEEIHPPAGVDEGINIAFRGFHGACSSYRNSHQRNARMPASANS
jgi:hypothetical protein